MPDIATGGLRIHFDVVGSGQPVLLMHGGSASSEFWRRAGYVDALSPDHRILLLDFRGHGASSRPHDATMYGLRFDVADALAAIDAAHLGSVTICGWSWGAIVGLALAALHPERVKSVLAIGASGSEGRFSDLAADLSFATVTSERIRTEGLRWLADEMENQARQGWLRDVVLENDPVAIAAWYRGIGDAAPIGCALADIRQPVLFLAGELELPRRHFPDPLLPRQAKLQVIPGETHVTAFLRVDYVVPALRTLTRIPDELTSRDARMG